MLGDILAKAFYLAEAMRIERAEWRLSGSHLGRTRSLTLVIPSAARLPEQSPRQRCRHKRGPLSIFPIVEATNIEQNELSRNRSSELAAWSVENARAV